MELVNKKKSVDESASANQLMLEIVNHSHIVQNNSFLILTLTYTTYTTIQLLKQKYQSKPFISYLNIKLMLSDKFVKYFL